MIIRSLALLLSVFLVGCSKVINPTLDFYIRPIVPKSLEDAYVVLRPDETSFLFARDVFRQANIELHILPVIVEPDDFFYTVNYAKFKVMVSKAEYYYLVNNKELAVWFVDGFKDGKTTLIGLSCIGNTTKNAYGTLVDIFSYQTTLAHELGHLFGLQHTWDGLCAKCSKTDIRPECRFNIMSYGNEVPSEVDFHYTLTNEQKQILYSVAKSKQ